MNFCPNFLKLILGKYVVTESFRKGGKRTKKLQFMLSEFHQCHKCMSFVGIRHSAKTLNEMLNCRSFMKIVGNKLKEVAKTAYR